MSEETTYTEVCTLTLSFDEISTCNFYIPKFYVDGKCLGYQIKIQIGESSSVATKEPPEAANGDYYSYTPSQEGEVKISFAVAATDLKQVNVWLPTKCFYGCKQITDITLNESVEINIIGNYAFEGTSITSFTFHKNTVLMDQDPYNSAESCWVFARCNQLTRFTVADDHEHYFTDDSGNLYGSRTNGNDKVEYGLLYYANGRTTTEGTVITSFDVPSIVSGKTITYIGNSAFCCNQSLTQITVPSSIEYIRPHAFYDCTKLSSITLGEGLEEIYDSVFYNCQSLTTLEIPSTVTKIVDSFVYCSNIEFTGGDGTYYYCKNGCLYEQYAGENASAKKKLKRCFISSTDESFTAPSNIVEIGGWAFNSLSLKEVKLHDDITKIGTAAFFNCKQLKTVILPQQLDTLSDRLFEASGLASIIVPPSVVSLCDSVFYNCSSLNSVSLPKGLTTIGDRVFQNCTSLINLTIPSTVQTIGTSLASGCTNLKSLTFADIEHSQLLTWESYGVYGCKALESLEFPPKLKVIQGEFAVGCSSLKQVIIPEGVIDTIHHFAFNNCSALTEVTIPKSVTNLNRGIFHGCTSLKKLALPFVGATWVKAGDQDYPSEGSADTQYRRSRLEFLFWNYSSNDNSSTLNKRLVKDQTRSDYPELIEVEITNAKSIPLDAFINCTDIQCITLNDEVESIIDTAFHGCNALESIVIGQETKSIGDSTFSSTGLKGIVIPDNVTNIGTNFCSGSRNLAKAVIGEKVQQFGKNAFNGCTRLKELVFKNPMPSAFDTNFTKLTGNIESIYVPSESIDAYKAMAKIIDSSSSNPESNLESKIRAIDTIEENYEDYNTNFNTMYYYRSFSKNGDTYEFSSATSAILPEQFTDMILQDKDVLCKLPYNIKLSDYKYAAQESITSALGGKYPLIRRNGDTYYRQFKLTGMLYVNCEKGGDTWDSRGVSLNSWIDPDLPTLYVADDSLIPGEMREEVQKAAYRRFIETRARTLLADFLSNGKPKLFKSQEEGLMIVYLSAVSFTPNASLDRHIYDFSATVTEVCEYNAANVKKYKLISDNGYTAYQVDLEG